jgi:hypothetical protein
MTETFLTEWLWRNDFDELIMTEWLWRKSWRSLTEWFWRTFLTDFKKIFKASKKNLVYLVKLEYEKIKIYTSSWVVIFFISYLKH